MVFAFGVGVRVYRQGTWVPNRSSYQKILAGEAKCKTPQTTLNASDPFCRAYMRTYAGTWFARSLFVRATTNPSNVWGWSLHLINERERDFIQVFNQQYKCKSLELHKAKSSYIVQRIMYAKMENVQHRSILSKDKIYNISTPKCTHSLSLPECCLPWGYILYQAIRLLSHQ